MNESPEGPAGSPVAALDRICALRSELDPKQRAQLLEYLEKTSWSSWAAWLLPHLPDVVDYSDSSPQIRRKLREGLGEDGLTMHHAAMFLVGLLHMAKQDCFPHELISREEKLNYDLFSVAAAIRAWDDIAMHCDNWLYWQFDAPSPKSSYPFKDE